MEFLSLYELFFVLLISVGILSIIFYLFFLKKIKTLTKNENVRSEISNDLNNELGNILTSVAMQSDVIGLTASDNASIQIDRLGLLSREAMVKMKDAIWVIDSSKDNIESLIDKMEDFLYVIKAQGKFNVLFSIKVKNMKAPLSPDLRQAVFIIFKEITINSLSRGRASELVIEIEHNKNVLKLCMKDNQSLDPESIGLTKLGLQKTELQMNKVNGHFELDTKNGFSIELLFPIL